jgi:ethanolamine kinase
MATGSPLLRGNSSALDQIIAEIPGRTNSRRLSNHDLNKLITGLEEFKLNGKITEPSAKEAFPHFYSAEEAHNLAKLSDLPREQRQISLTLFPDNERLLTAGLYIVYALLYAPFALQSTKDSTQFPLLQPTIPPQFRFSTVHGGITNQLYKCWLISPENQEVLANSRVLIRVYGVKTELVIDRERENSVVDKLSQNSFGVTIWGRFSNGRVEGWLEGNSLLPAEMLIPNISAGIAQHLHRMHHLDIDFLPRQITIYETLPRWIEIAKSIDFPENKEKQAALNNLNLPAIERELLEQVSLLKADPIASGSPLVFAHNDLLSGNVMLSYTVSSALSSESAAQLALDRGEISISFVDFEYGAYNPRGYDLANHFFECCGFECDYRNFPNLQQQKHFVQNYLGNLATEEAISGVLREARLWLPMSHLFWCIWAIVQSKYSLISFDYLEYAKLRFTGYNQQKEWSREALSK